jgi:hypothetical protein
MKMIKGLSNVFLMLIALFDFTVIENDKNVRLKKKISNHSDVDLIVTSENGDVNNTAIVSIINIPKQKEVFKTFKNLYDAMNFIKNELNVLYDQYRNVSQNNGPFSYKYEPYYIMAVSSTGESKFIKINATSSTAAVEKIKPNLLALFGYNYNNEEIKIDVKIMSEDEAQKFAGFVMKS